MGLRRSDLVSKQMKVSFDKAYYWGGRLKSGNKTIELSPEYLRILLDGLPKASGM